jgi:putative aldouronate transport system permease protein
MGYGQLYILMIPGLIYYVLFRYVPIYGIIIGFKEFNFMKGIWDSPWIGLENFRYMFQAPSFKQVFSNTLVLGFLKLIVGFPLPILFAVLLNEVYQAKFKKLVQTISYLPHFLSWVVLGGIFFQFFSINGPINVLIEALGLKPISFLTDPGWFRFVLVSTHVWKVMGWNSIVFLAAIAGINPEMYEAAMIDGAGRVQRIIHITIPSLAPVITVMFILAAGQIINDDFDQIFNLYNPAVYRTADVISTYVYRQGLEQLNFSYATAVELFKNLIALALVWSTNRVSKKINEYGIW